MFYIYIYIYIYIYLYILRVDQNSCTVQAENDKLYVVEVVM